MVSREIISTILERATKMPVIAITGPRQTGKTTIVQSLFPGYTYVTLENPNEREKATRDPKAWLLEKGPKLIIDEAQYVPDLFSYIQVLVDENRKMGEYILTGSQHFLLLEKITQSLAGRVAMFSLLPFSIQELQNEGFKFKTYDEWVWRGFYPPIIDRKLEPGDWLPSYIETYVEKDIRQILQVQNHSDFRRFLRLCAGHVGQIVNYSEFGGQLGLSYQTAKRWLSVLETSFIVYMLPAHFGNFNKRLVKSPKLYFYDTGLAANLLGISNPDQINGTQFKGALFENFIINELIKSVLNRGLRPDFYYWRDSAGHEVDLLVEMNGQIRIIEIKAGDSVKGEFFKGLEYYQALSKGGPELSYLIYGGDENSSNPKGNVLGWRDATKAVK